MSKINGRTFLVQRNFGLPTTCHNCGLRIEKPPYLRKLTRSNGRIHNCYCVDCAVLLKIIPEKT